MDLAAMIENKIINFVKDSRFRNHYRKPLVGFASAGDPLFNQMKKDIGPHIVHPCEMLSNAKTVVAFFLPFSEEIVNANRKNKNVDVKWAAAYIDTNRLITGICRQLKDSLSKEGINSAAEKPTHNFNEEDLTAGWSHKSAAYVAGLGKFGLHRMLITRAGCAGRFGSIVISAEINPTERPQKEYCLFYSEGKCLFCVNNCPTGALKESCLDKKRCYQQLLDIDRIFPNLGFSDVCGKCAVGPCALKAPAL